LRTAQRVARAAYSLLEIAVFEPPERSALHLSSSML